MSDNQESSMSAAEMVASSAASEVVASAMPFDASTGSGLAPHHLAQFVGEAFSAVDAHFKELGLDDSQIAAAKEKVVAAAHEKVASAAAEVGPGAAGSEGPMRTASEVGPVDVASEGPVATASEIGPATMTASELLSAAELLSTAAEAGPALVMVSSETSPKMSAAEVTETAEHVRRWRDELSSVLNSL